MTASLIIKNTHPHRDFDHIIQVGLKAFKLASEHAGAIEPRLPGMTAGLKTDVDALGVVIPGALQARAEAKAATGAQRGIAQQACLQVRAIRATVRKSGASKAVQKAYGVGLLLAPTKVAIVKAAIQQIVNRATSAPEEAEGFGLQAADVASLTALLTALTSADSDQDVKRANAPQSTRARNVTANRVLKMAAIIAGTGMRAFAHSPTEYGLFKALMASTGRAPKSAGKKAPQGSEPPKPPDPSGTGPG